MYLKFCLILVELLFLFLAIPFQVGSVDMLHCYYAHGEDNENFQRRSYWMLEQELMHIVFVHYLEVKGNRANISSIRDTETVSSNSQNESSFSTSSAGNYDALASPYADTTSPTSTLTSACEDAESMGQNPENIPQMRPRVQAYVGRPQDLNSQGIGNLDVDLASSYDMLPRLGTQTSPSLEHMSFPDGHGGVDPAVGNLVSGEQQTLDLASWEEVLGHCSTGIIPNEQKSWNASDNPANWQGDYSLHMQGLPSNQNLMPGSSYFGKGSFMDQKSLSAILQNADDPFFLMPEGQESEHAGGGIQKLHANIESGYFMNQKTENGLPPVLKQSHLSGIQAEESLKKVDSFSRWMAKELGEVADLQLPPSNGYSWSSLNAEDVVGDPCTPSQLQLDTDTLNFSLSQEQLFSIAEISPNWAYSNLETKVVINGRFLKSGDELANCRWSCMFGEVEVPAEILSEGVLCCRTPPHKAGIVPFYVTYSNRLACSEIREFEYRMGPCKEAGISDIPEGDSLEVHLQKRLQNLLLMDSTNSNQNLSENTVEKKEAAEKIISLMEAEFDQMATSSSVTDISQRKVTVDQQVETWLKEKFFSWLLQRVREDGKGPLVVDNMGQGVLHLAAALGFNWALKPMMISGVSIDFRDVNGWTALHWAALCGREETVVALVSLGATPGASTDPSGEYPLGRTPADLASANGHKGISGFLAECSLTKHLSTLTMKDDILEGSGSKAIQTVSERVASPFTEEDVPESLSLKDSLAAVCNATQAAARIHQIYRIQSFQRKQLNQDGDESTADEQALSLVAARASRLGKHDYTAHVAAISIQKRYRGWKKRKEYLLIRQRIVKIQAHIRGHQVRKKYKSIVWTVGILEKVILRWRRKGSGLRGFRPDAVAKSPTMEDVPQKEDDYDFLKDGRKQTEERMQKALARVKSMAQHPEARAQYRRLLTVAEGLRETEETSSMSLRASEDMNYPDEELFDVESLLDDDTFMSLAFQ
ncbi:OLC1v1002633C3 [Oldenlandia corymbosa var. corymbosa]|uniref:OLC1v1002633C3 n=1 Tax=Oldenlandia corymbosa var. corymbosa TaxID=529605 RepID=A0AAV1D8V6_OLDCO|nr:OLC1v1002633C3 [Oldenlandia corymbosa var. corymbosa]